MLLWWPVVVRVVVGACMWWSEWRSVIAVSMHAKMSTKLVGFGCCCCCALRSGALPRSLILIRHVMYVASPPHSAAVYW